mmetsp:Transcript_22084/g.34617  ORF Transcript_22084/g.34617 Transcript_22084/m.34617 type:complete len:141 (-) Transcript_22084:113-535(-)
MVEWIQDDNGVAGDDGSQELSEKLESLVGHVDWEANCKTAKELEPLVEEWKRLVVDGKWERLPNQLNQLLEDLGPMPTADRPMDRALWVAALIDPLPAIGASPEIRLAVLRAPSTAAALSAVLVGIKKSISHLDRSDRMW